MGVEPPFLYDHPSKYSFLGPADKSFNPKAVTQASWAPPRSRPQHNGPLIDSPDFNRHPDSYWQAPYGNTQCKPMSPNTKTKIRRVRIAQLCLRIMALLGALGMLFCVICIRGTDGTTGWIIRVPPSVAILQTLYAIYHLSRSAKIRPPASSASYMLFAAFIDASLLPFYGFAAMASYVEITQPSNSSFGHWTTILNGETISTYIIHAFFWLSVVDGALHLVSLAVSIYLGVVFRKIASLPPDMNPLEDNLTSRHKRNKSSITETFPSQASTAVSSPNRQSKIEDPLASPPRSMPFMHTRNDSRTNVSLLSAEFPPPRVPSNMVEPLPDRTQMLSLRASRTLFPSLTLAADNAVPQEQTAQIKRSATKSSSIYSTGSDGAMPVSNNAPSLPETNSNWISHFATQSSPARSPGRELNFLRNNPKYEPLPQSSPFEYNNENAHSPVSVGKHLPKPLEMNPPTPPMSGDNIQRKPRIKTPGPSTQRARRILSPTTGNGWGPGTIGIGKARQWSVSGINTTNIDNKGIVGTYGNTMPKPNIHRNNANGGGAGRDAKSDGGARGRVISRSGVEISAGGILPTGGVRAREVSGKVMEEGRGGAGTGAAWM